MKPTELLVRLGAGEGRLFQRGPGCERCRGLGAVGRMGVFELVVVTPAVRALIVARASEAELRQCLSGTEGAQTMFQDGLTKVLDGRVAYDEPVRVTEPDQAWLEGHDGPAAPAPPALSPPSLTIVPRS